MRRTHLWNFPFSVCKAKAKKNKQTKKAWLKYPLRIEISYFFLFFFFSSFILSGFLSLFCFLERKNLLQYWFCFCPFHHGRVDIGLLTTEIISASVPFHLNSISANNRFIGMDESTHTHTYNRAYASFTFSCSFVFIVGKYFTCIESDEGKKTHHCLFVSLAVWLFLCPIRFSLLLLLLRFLFVCNNRNTWADSQIT